MMKNIFLLLLTSTFLIVSCTEDFDLNDQYGSLEDLPGYVAFDASGTNAVSDDVTAAETDGTVSVTVEVPTGTFSDVTVNYSLSGDAVFGTDYTIAGATAAGGSLTIEHKQTNVPEDYQNFDNADIDIVLLTDGVDDGTKTITITLTSASNDDGDLDVGRGGTGALASQDITITDVPLTLELSETSLSRFESDSDSVSFSIDIPYAIDVDLSFTFGVDGTNGSLDGSAASYSLTSASPGTVTISAGETSAPVTFAYTDDGTATGSATGLDSLIFAISGETATGKDITLGSDTLQIDIQDDAKELMFAEAADTVTVGNVTVYNYDVVLMDTLSLSATPAFADITVPYTITGTAVAGVDYTDVTAGSVTVSAGESSATISIQVLRTGETTPPTVTLTLGTLVTTDGEVLGVGDNDDLTIEIE